MMRSAIGVFAVSLLAGAAFSADTSALKGDGKYGDAGCGLGSMVFHDQKGFIQVLAATTNNAIFPQTSAISSGTSNCAEDGIALNEKEREFFAEANFESLHQEMAQGKGENLEAFASLFGCRDQGVRNFQATAQANYGVLFPSAETSAAQMLEKVEHMVKHNSALQSSCDENG
jgi:hypothetical protein